MKTLKDQIVMSKKILTKLEKDKRIWTKSNRTELDKAIIFFLLFLNFLGLIELKILDLLIWLIYNSKLLQNSWLIGSLFLLLRLFLIREEALLKGGR